MLAVYVIKYGLNVTQMLHLVKCGMQGSQQVKCGAEVCVRPAVVTVRLADMPTHRLPNHGLDRSQTGLLTD